MMLRNNSRAAAETSGLTGDLAVEPAWLLAAIRAARPLLVMMALLGPPSFAAVPREVRVVVVTTFELGADSGDVPGELQNWVEKLPLPETLPFPSGGRALRYNRQKRILAVVTGSGAINAAASITALGLDPRFDLSRAYWLVAGIAGVNANVASVGSVAWAEWVVDRDLLHEIDAREIPPDWSTGLVPLSRSRPFQAPPPAPGIFSPNVYHLHGALVAWAFALTRDVALADSADLATIRAGYDQPAARTPPHVLKGDEVSAMAWWLGDIMNRTAEQWMDYWTDGRGVMATTAMEDCGVLQALARLAQTGRADVSRVLVLRGASNYTAPGRGGSAAGLLAAESADDGATHLSAFLPALTSVYQVGAKVANALSAGWPRTRTQIPGATP